MKKTQFNKAQALCLETYANGDFAHLLEIDSQASFDAALLDCGDGLLRFLVVELATSEDCDSTDTAINQIATAISDLTVVKDMLEARPQEESWPTPPRG